MKKTFLSIAVVGAMFAVNGYADNQMVAVYTCQNGCNVINDKTNFSCIYPDGKSCGGAKADIFVSQTTDAMIASNGQQRSDQVSGRSATVAARAAAKPTQRPNSGASGNSSGPDKTVVVTCPRDCKYDCDKITQPDGTQLNVCACKTKSGALCEEKVQTTQNGPVSF